MIENLQIRTFLPSDLEKLHEIREAAFKTVFQSFRELLGQEIAPVALADAEREQAQHLDQICKQGADHHVFVVAYGSELVAFCSVSLNQNSKIGEIDLNAVHPDYQGKGIGTLMYDHALDIMRKAGMQVATVGTGGDSSHAPARRAYKKAGFGPAIPNMYLYRSL